ncbi:LysR family transcriptional regulator [Jannaschia sp. W003]|uniref:LysR family transcriptional regulator n=1 Tax=Jannaschia sp. W003 TaxID=2867012 RepID=UPI0021A949B7|nr:LysR family transcriptional regulator [Jannaschia sp. W003]UWQ21545.1 LysR family transcriptional regulator [Jannaschia sp. W003]
MIKGRLTLKQLDAFVAVVDAGSFRRAADLLGTTQPNVSARIAALEAVLGARLMHRDAGSVRLTAAGDVLLVEARAVLAAAEALLERAGRRDAVAGRLRLGATELVAATWLRAFLRRLRADWPAIAVELEVDLSAAIARRLRDGECDLALIAGAAPAPGDVDLGESPFGWLAAPALAERLGPRPDVADLLPHGVLTHARGTAAAGELLGFCAAEGLPVDRIVTSSSAAATLQMAEDGMGVALVPPAMARGQIAAGTLWVVEAAWTPAPLRVVARIDPGRAAPFVRRAAALAAEASAEHRDS